jgi:hypothetical protein
MGMKSTGRMAPSREMEKAIRSEEERVLPVAI